MVKLPSKPKVKGQLKKIEDKNRKLIIKKPAQTKLIHRTIIEDKPAAQLPPRFESIRKTAMNSDICGFRRESSENALLLKSTTAT